MASVEKSMYDQRLGLPTHAEFRIKWGAMQISARNMSYRAVAGTISDKLERLGSGGISFSQLHKRVASLKVHRGVTDVTDARVMAFGSGSVEPRPHAITVAVDSTGMSPDRPSGWKVYHWNQRYVRGWYKLHAAVNVDTNEILAYVVTDPFYGDSNAFCRLVDQVLEDGHTVSKILADAAYDNKDHWNRMKERGIEFIANIRGSLDPMRRSSGCGKFKGCSVRGKHVLRILEVGREQWKEEVGYGTRWKVESTFSDMKRMFRDTIRARGPDRVADMIKWIIDAHNLYKSIRASL